MLNKRRIIVFIYCLFFILSVVFAEQEKPTTQEIDLDALVSKALDSVELTQLSVEESNLEEEKITSPEVPKEKIIIDVLELKDMDILDVLKLISKKSGLNIVAGKNVRAKITIFLKDVDVRDALRIILESNDLAYEEEDGIIKVMTAHDYELIYGKKFSDKTQAKIVSLRYARATELVPILTQMKSVIGKVMADEKSNTVVLIDAPSKLTDMLTLINEIDVPIVSKIFNLNYSKAEDLEKKISETLTKNVGSLKIDARSNKMFVTDTPTKMREIESLISAFDEKHKEVLIEAKIVKVILSDQYKMGVDWEALLSKWHGLDFKGSFSVLTTTDKKGKITIGTLANDDYTAMVEALDSVGRTNTLSSPRITVINNEEAKILVGSTEPYVTTTTTTPASGPTTTAESINFIDVGVKLYVTPTINQDKFITMKIRPEVSSVSSYLTTAQNNKIPIVDTSEAETSVMVKDGVTIVIGGLIKDELIDTVNKVPILGDIPLVGLAFRNRDKLTKKTELVIFLTPHIISGDFEPYAQTKESLSTKKK